MRRTARHATLLTAVEPRQLYWILLELSKRFVNVMQERYVEAAPLYEESHAIRVKVLGPGHPDVAGSLSQWASVLSQQVMLPRMLSISVIL